MNWEVTNGKIYCDGREVNGSLVLKNRMGVSFDIPTDVQKLGLDPKRFWKVLGAAFQVEKIIASGPAVTIIWKNHEKTRVKIDECSEYSIYFAFCSAVCKRLFGSNSTIKREISNHLSVDWERVSDEAFDDLINYVEAPEWCYE
jgi:hypothetical protein